MPRGLTEHEDRHRQWRIEQLARDGRELELVQQEGRRFIIGPDVLAFEKKGICPRAAYRASRAATDLLRKSSRHSGPVWWNLLDLAKEVGIEPTDMMGVIAGDDRKRYAVKAVNEAILVKARDRYERYRDMDRDHDDPRMISEAAAWLSEGIADAGVFKDWVAENGEQLVGDRGPVGDIDSELAKMPRRRVASPVRITPRVPDNDSGMEPAAVTCASENSVADHSAASGLFSEELTANETELISARRRALGQNALHGAARDTLPVSVSIEGQPIYRSEEERRKKRALERQLRKQGLRR